LLSRFVAFVARHRLTRPGGRVVAAVSGGADSTCLLHLLLEARPALGISVEAAHFNHRLRGAQADRDAEAAASMARRLGLRFHLGLGRPFTADERRAASVQELARRARLDFLLSLARRRRAAIALGHNADDQAETLLMRLLAGAGPAGLAGIPPASHGGLLLHPLLFARRSAIEAWLEQRAIGWRTDRTNRSRHYLRNRVRLDLLPLIARDYNPRIVARLGALAEQLRRDNALLEDLAAGALAAAAAGPRSYHFPPRLLARTPAAVLSRALLSALRDVAGAPADFSGRHVEALLAPGPGSRSWDLPGGVAGRRDGSGLAICRTAAAREPAPMPLSALAVPGRAVLPDGRTVSARAIRRPARFDPRVFGADPNRVALDLAQLEPPFTVRGRLPGDRLRPLGLAGEKRLKELLIDAGVPARQRSRVPLVCDRRGIVWVAGLRPDERGRVDAGSRRLLVLELGDARQAAPAGPPRPASDLSGTRGPATTVSSSNSASSAMSSGRVRLRTPSRAGSPAAPEGATSTSSARTGRSRSSTSSGPSAVRSDSAGGAFTATTPSRPGRVQR
jgi:tRNA(Ile)-lysidine synthase